MTEAEIREMVETDCSFTLVPDGLLLPACEIPNFVKALHKKIIETTFATVEQIEKSGWVSPECLEKTCSDLVDQHLEAEDKLKEALKKERE